MSPYKYEVAHAGDPFGAYRHIYDRKNIPVNESLDFAQIRCSNLLSLNESTEKLELFVVLHREDQPNKYWIVFILQ